MISSLRSLAMADRFALLGSGEFDPWTEPVDRRLVEQATGDGSVLILPTASAPEGDDVFDRWASMGLDHYSSLGIPARVVSLKTRRDASRPELIRPLASASVVFFSGGNPAYLAGVLVGSRFWGAVLGEMRRGLAFAGCSAGISCLGDRVPDSAVRDPTRDGHWRPGLGLFPRTWLGPHWDALDRFIPGLRDFIVASVPPDSRLLGVDEQTAVVGDGTTWTVMGSGAATLYRGGQSRRHASGETFEAELLAPGGLGPGEERLDLSST
jgi:cyanophycinase